MVPTLRLLLLALLLLPVAPVQAATFTPGALGPPLGPEAARALAALDGGDARAAKGHLAKAPPAGAEEAAARRVLAARIHEALGDWKAAATAWGEAAAQDPVAAPWLAAREVAAALAGGASERARAALGTIPAGHPAEARARLSVARALADEDRPADALEVLTGGAGRWGARAGEAWGLEARIRERVGQKVQAAPLWRRLYLEAPLASEAGEARTRLEARGALPSAADRVARLEHLLQANRSTQVLDEAPAVIQALEAGSAPWCRAVYAEGKALRMRRDHRAAIPRLRAVTEGCIEPGLRVKGLYLLASSLSIAEGDPAIPVYETLAARFPGHSFADDALFYVAELHQRAGRTEAALATLDRQAETWPDGDFHAEALWRSFWIHWEGGTPEAGLATLERLAETHRDDPFQRARALYWQARTRARSPEAATEADALYARVFREHPLSYYGALALERLKARDAARAAAEVAALPPRPSAPPDPRLEVANAFLSDPSIVTGRRLLALGLREEAARVLGRARTAATGDAEALALAFLLEAAGDPGAAHRILRTRVAAFHGEWPAGSHWRVWQAAWPLAFRGQVERATKEFQVPIDLLQALIREESALDPQVVSWAGAVGLAQLMPATAADLARRVGLRHPPSRRELTDPALNLRLSARYLADLLRSTGHPALAIAAYNGGPGTIRRWLKDRGDLELDAFVESMSYSETRGYTRRVLQSWATYRYLYGEADARFLGLSPNLRRR